METLPVRMRLWRARYRVSQDRAAYLADVHVKTWQRWEQGIAEPAPFHLDDLELTLASPPPGWDRTSSAPAR